MRSKSNRRHPERRLWSLPLALAALMAALLPAVGPTWAAEDEGDEEQKADPQPLEVTQEGYYTNSSGQAVPPTVSDRFPPGVVCLVFPEACSSATRPVTGPVNDLLQDNQPEEVIQDDEAPTQPAVVEGTLPTGISGGAMRYVSALRFDLPPVPENRELVKAELILDQAGTNYRSDSPAFREAVEAAIICATQRTQEHCEREFGQALQPEQGHFREGEEVPYRVDACQILGEWEGEDNQDWEQQPEVDCIVNAAAGAEDPETGIWTFDITFIVESWLDGATPNRGLLLGPQSAENLAFGDPDTSNNAQISFAGGEYAAPDSSPPRIRYELTEASASGPVTTLPPPSGGGGEETFTPESSGGDETFEPSSPPASSGGLGTSAFGPVPSVTADEAASPPPEPAPEVAEPAPPPAAPIAAEQPAPYTPWWVWLLIPLGLAGLYVLARSLEAEPQAAGEERAGAMTRLINQRLARSTAGPLVQV